MNDRTGEHFGAYRLLRLLDAGGFADVYLGEHRQLKTHQAIKVLQMLLFEEDQQQNFLQEARLIAHLKHPHIIQVVDFGFENHQPFLVMTYAPQGNLRQRHPSGSRVPPDLVIAYISQIASALQYAHNQYVIHRDIKPENLLIGQKGEILLSDFGIAIIARSSRSQSLQEIVGTTTYMAPEQIKGRPRPASDQYALAVLAYEWLGGTPPFQGDTDLAIARQHLLDAPPSLFQYAPDISPALAAVISRALHKDYRQRFASIQDFAEALEQAYRTGVAPALPSTPEGETTSDNGDVEKISPEYPEHSPSGRVPRRVLIGLIGAGAVALTLGGLAGWLALARRQAARVVMHSRSLPTPAPTSPPATPAPAPGIGQTVYAFTQHGNWIDTVAWSPNSQNIVSCSLDGTVMVWDAFDGTPINSRSGFELGTSNDPNQRVGVAGDFNRGAAWSPDGKHIASNSEGNATIEGKDVNQGTVVTLWQASSGASENSLGDNGVLAWSPNGKYVAIGNFIGDVSAQVYDSTTGALVVSYYGHIGSDQLPNLRSIDQTNTVSGIAWSPDSQYIVTCGGDNTVQIWNALSGVRVSSYTRASLSSSTNYPFMVYGVAWSPGGTLIASGWERNVDVTDPMTGQLLKNYQEDLNSFYALAWSPDSTRLALAGTDNSVSIWQWKTNKRLFSYRRHSGIVTTVAWSPNGEFIASGGADRTVQIWRAN